MKRILKNLVLTSMFAALGCGLAKDSEEAQVIVDGFYKAIQAQEYDKALSLLSPEAAAATPLDQWRPFLEIMNTTMGGIQSFEETGGFNVSKNMEVGTEVKLEYTVRYAGNLVTTEKFTVTKPPGGKLFQIKNYDRKIVSGEPQPAKSDSIITS